MKLTFRMWNLNQPWSGTFLIVARKFWRARKKMLESRRNNFITTSKVAAKKQIILKEYYTRGSLTLLKIGEFIGDPLATVITTARWIFNDLFVAPSNNIPRGNNCFLLKTKELLTHVFSFDAAVERKSYCNKLSHHGHFIKTYKTEH